MKPTPYMHVHFATFIRTTGNLVNGSWSMCVCFVSLHVYIIVQLPICAITVDGTCFSQKTSTTPHPQLGQSHPFITLDNLTRMLFTGMLIF